MEPPSSKPTQALPSGIDLAPRPDHVLPMVQCKSVQAAKPRHHLRPSALAPSRLFPFPFTGNERWPLHLGRLLPFRPSISPVGLAWFARCRTHLPSVMYARKTSPDRQRPGWLAGWLWPSEGGRTPCPFRQSPARSSLRGAAGRSNRDRQGRPFVVAIRVACC